jgi:hypothetical protein
MTEQLGFYEVFRQGAAINGHHLQMSTRACRVKGPGDHFFSSARLAGDQNGCSPASNQSNDFNSACQGRARTH